MVDAEIVKEWHAGKESKFKMATNLGVTIFKNEFIYSGNNTDVYRVDGRSKSLDSIIEKANRKGYTNKTFDRKIDDCAAVRIIVFFESQVMPTVEYIKEKYMGKAGGFLRSDKPDKDYLHNPKANGYMAYHFFGELLIDGELITVEIQVRSLFEDCWAVLEHFIQYKPKHNSSEPSKKKIYANLKKAQEKMREAERLFVESFLLSQPTKRVDWTDEEFGGS